MQLGQAVPRAIGIDRETASAGTRPGPCRWCRGSPVNTRVNCRARMDCVSGAIIVGRSALNADFRGVLIDDSFVEIYEY